VIVLIDIIVSIGLRLPYQFNIRVKGWPVAAGFSGVVRESFKSLKSAEVFAASDLTVVPTGPNVVSSMT
jgi:hypothetical protein